LLTFGTLITTSEIPKIKKTLLVVYYYGTANETIRARYEAVGLVRSDLPSNKVVRFDVFIELCWFHAAFFIFHQIILRKRESLVKTVRQYNTEVREDEIINLTRYANVLQNALHRP
jgi:hypothetical protein